MHIEQRVWRQENGWNKPAERTDAQFVIYFAGRELLGNPEYYNTLATEYPDAQILGCSTGGEIYGGEVLDDSMVVAAVTFEKTAIRVAQARLESAQDSFATGRQIAQMLNQPDLVNIFILSDGTNINGSELLRGLFDVLDKHVIVTGGLAGDGANFKHTLVGLNGQPQNKCVAAVGFYGSGLMVKYGSVGGWSPFGPQRVITRAEGNRLYELDGKPALDLYKEYLGAEEASKLPVSGLMFPLSIRPSAASQHEIVRTVADVDEKEKALVFVGDIPNGYIAQLMRGDFNLLIDGAVKAAESSLGVANDQSLAILVSCVGRKLLLGQAISDETEAIAELFKHTIPTIGFYSYGEICHQQFTGECSLHNQTMTVTMLYER